MVWDGFKIVLLFPGLIGGAFGERENVPEISDVLGEM